jgi:hypothetical protein
MAVPITFPTTSAHFGLPLLFAGQAQKEFFLNQSIALIDALLQQGVIASTGNPPQNPAEGACYRIIQGASGIWADHEGAVAIHIGGAWQYISPFNGMSVFDQAAGIILRYNSGWQFAEEPGQPQGGTLIDTEARQTLSELVEALRKIGIFPDLT